MGRKQPHHQVRSSVRELHLYLLVVLLGESLSHRPSLIYRLQLGSDRAAGAAEHPYYLPNISPDTHPVEQPSECVERLLKPPGISGRNQAVVRVEEVSAVNHPPPPPTRLDLSHHHQYPVVHHCVYDHVENGRGQWAPLSYPPKTSKRLCQLCLLEDAHVQVGMDHPPQCQIKSSVPAVRDII